MAHCTCINGHLMWNGDGKQIYLPYRLNFFKQKGCETFENKL